MNSPRSRQQAAGRPTTKEQRCRPPVAVCLLCVTIASAACGKKGPPLAPFSNLPAAVTSVTAKRVGSQVVFQFTVPKTNIDGRQPADLDRVELYVHTTRLLQPADYLKRGTLVGAVKVRRPPPPAEEGQPPAGGQTPPPGVDQGAVATIVEKAGGAAPAPVPVSARGETGPEESQPLFAGGGGPLLSPRRSAPATRFYLLAGVNRQGRPGAFSPIVEVPLIDAPVPPAGIRVTYTENALSVSWMAPSVPLRHPIQSVALQDDALPSRPVVSFTASGGYNVYEVPPDTKAAAPDGDEPILVPLNPSPLTDAMFEESRVEFGTERCFMVRTQETVGGVVAESAASQVACVTPADIFPPAPPRSVAAVASEGAISLIWEPNDEADLNGYLVLRGEAPGEKLQALTRAPMTETTYRDATVQRGVEYVYAVVAVDKANNISAQSNRVPERGR